MRQRVAAGPAISGAFFLLVPNLNQVVFDRHSDDIRLGEQVLALALPLLEAAAGSKVEGRVATSPNAYDDIVDALTAGEFHEVILSTLPTHVSHWLHVDLPKRVAELGYPLITVTPQPARHGHPPGHLRAPARVEIELPPALRPDSASVPARCGHVRHLHQR